MADALPAATELRVRRATAELEVDFTDGATVRLPAEFLRVESPSAEVQGHGPNDRKLVSGKRGVSIVAVEPVGHYAVRIRFSDGHDSGIFSWVCCGSWARSRLPAGTTTSTGWLPLAATDDLRSDGLKRFPV